jgi:hypothetical protein
LRELNGNFCCLLARSARNSMPEHCPGTEPVTRPKQESGPKTGARELTTRAGAGILYGSQPGLLDAWRGSGRGIRMDAT